MNAFIIPFLMLTTIQFVVSQSVGPAGVPGVSIWSFENQKSDLTELNFHAPLELSHNAWNVSNTQGMTLFSVFNSDRHDEQLLWSLSQTQEEPIILTTHRLADLDQIEYMNFDPLASQFTTLNIYSSESGQQDQNTIDLQLFETNSRYDLPVDQFDGQLLEFLVFERPLSAIERLKVESHLALKYGITLRHPFHTQYIDAEETAIWSNENESDFAHHIIGIGKDQEHDLFQSKSTPAEFPGLIMLEADSMREQSFLMIGSTNQPMNTIVSRGIKRLQREWMTFATRWKGQYTTISFDQNEIFARPEKDETYWLMIDHDGSGQFDADNVQLVSATPDEERITFDSLQFGLNGRQKQYFQILIAPKFFAHSHITNAVCGEMNGAIQLKAAGGQSPYRIEVHDENGQLIHATENIESHLEINNLASGRYQFALKDALNQILEQSVDISNDEAPLVELPGQVIIGAIQSLDAYHASHDAKVNYQWSTPDGQIINSSRISIEIPGQYTLVVEKDDCRRYHQVEVSKPLNHVFENVSVYPNPTSKGDFTLDMELREQSDVICSFFDARGRQLSSTVLNAVFHQSQKMNLPGPSGLYYIRLQANDSVQTIPILKQSK